MLTSVIFSWRRLRKGAHRCLAKDVTETFAPFQSLEAVLIAEGLLRDPDAWDKHFQRYELNPDSELYTKDHL